ncbi:MAG: hypothetical protein ACLTV6_15715 [Christensenellales bacterium]
MAQHVLDLLKERGFIAQMTFEDELYEQLKTRRRSTSALTQPPIPCTSATTSRSWQWHTCSARAIAPLP